MTGRIAVDEVENYLAGTHKSCKHEAIDHTHLKTRVTYESPLRATFKIKEGEREMTSSNTELLEAYLHLDKIVLSDDPRLAETNKALRTVLDAVKNELLPVVGAGAKFSSGGYVEKFGTKLGLLTAEAAEGFDRIGKAFAAMAVHPAIPYPAFNLNERDEK